MFRHEARWNEAESAIEMHLVSMAEQRVQVANASIDFTEGESIHTESSRKYDIAAFQRLASKSGWTLSETWTDPAELFAVAGLSVED